MKKLLFALVLHACFFTVSAQTTITADQAKSLSANIMASFTDAASFAYTKGITLDQFKSRLCGKAAPVYAGNLMIEEAYNYLNRGTSKADIAKQNNGVAVANAFKFLLDQHKKGIEPDGTEIFGGRTALDANGNQVSKVASGCRWYQFWCLVQEFANWVVANWAVIAQIISFLLAL